MTPYLDLASARRPGREVQRVNVDFPIDLLARIDREATRIGVTRQAFIKMRIADTLTSTAPDRRLATDQDAEKAGARMIAKHRGVLKKLADR